MPLNAKQISIIVKYWKDSSDRDFETMKGLVRLKKYPESLFFGHMVLEKILKALVVKHTKEHAPRIHDLLRLSQLAGLKIKTQDEDYLDIINSFNIEARYPDYKMSFYKRCTVQYSKKYSEIIYKRVRFSKSLKGAILFGLNICKPKFTELINQQPDIFFQPDYLLVIPKSHKITTIIVSYDLIPIIFKDLYMPSWKKFWRRWTARGLTSR